MVSPVDKEGGDIGVRPPNVGSARLNQSSLSGDRITYSSYRAFADPLSEPFSSQYLARRDPESGWSSESISPPQEGVDLLRLSQLDTLFKVFSPELETGWNWTNFRTGAGARRAAEIPQHLPPRQRSGELSGLHRGQTGRRRNPRSRSTRSLSRPVPGGLPLAGNRTTDAAPTAKTGPADLPALRVLLPRRRGSGERQAPQRAARRSTASALENGVGSPSAGLVSDDRGRASLLAGALSEDGTRVFFSASTNSLPGTLYLRLNPTQPESARINGAASGKGDLIGPAGASGKTQNGSAFLTEVKVKSGKFAVGQQITDDNGGIPAGTTITAIEETEAGVFKFTLSAAATKSKKPVELTGLASEVLSNVSTETRRIRRRTGDLGPGHPRRDDGPLGEPRLAHPLGQSHPDQSRRCALGDQPLHRSRHQGLHARGLGHGEPRSRPLLGRHPERLAKRSSKSAIH